MSKEYTQEEIDKLNELNAPPWDKWEIKQEMVFPMTYFYGKLPEGTDVDHQECIDWLLKHKDDETLRNSPDEWDTKNEDIRIPSEVDCFQKLMIEIDNLVLNITQGQLEIEGIWGQVVEKGGSTAYHHHQQDYLRPNVFDLSFVYYLQASEDHGALVFPNHFQGIEIPKEVYPQSGRIVLFPAFMGHYVRRNNHDSPRVVVSGNYRQLKSRELFEGVQDVYKNILEG